MYKRQPYVNSTDELVSQAVECAEAAGLVRRGDLVVVTAGVPVGVSGTTNMIRVQQDVYKRQAFAPLFLELEVQ